MRSSRGIYESWVKGKGIVLAGTSSAETCELEGRLKSGGAEHRMEEFRSGTVECHVERQPGYEEEKTKRAETIASTSTNRRLHEWRIASQKDAAGTHLKRFGGTKDSKRCGS
ncbi:hypothetical protein GALMADRAFT_232179 [Galerina marginata CBS 339.88]|uniref:Uncharacterized protein n=1 Tax=Galerina marginata (strain CBS 339.88) TaxID=685588 RepID=A0A067S8C7_GALM3|nr:hypothetical protein GALMADRAFT_232179 [Galerina marginata CBS 339.88]